MKNKMAAVKAAINFMCFFLLLTISLCLNHQ
jgi:hypothetical protein